VQFSASVTGTSNTGVTWSVNGVAGGNSSVGTITASGLYTAPTQPGSYTITATSVADSTKTASATLTVNASGNVAILPPAATIITGGTQQFSGYINNVTSTALTWSVDGVSGGSATVGTISNTGLYKGPSAVGAHTITATSTANPSLSATASITVTNQSAGSVLTYHNDDARDGAFTQETTLTPQNVNSAQFGKLFSYHVDGQVYAQPLYMPAVNIAGSIHELVFVETQGDGVYAFDATPAQKVWWSVRLGSSVTKNDATGVNPVVGILSTPVIDASTSTMYVVAEACCGTDPTPFYLHALDITTGADKFGGPVNITASVTGTEGTPTAHTISLEDFCYQRMGLALNPVTNDIEIAFGSCDHGWLLAYNKTSLQQTAVFNDTPDGMGGGLWASGGAPAIDDITGDIYLMSGVDAGDQNFTDMQYNDSFVRLNPHTLAVLDYFTPDNNLILAENDADLGSGSNILMPNNSSSTPHETIGGGKDGNVFVVNRDNMGMFHTTNDVIQTQYIGTKQYNNIFSTPAYWNGSLYFHSNADVLKAFSWESSTGLMSTSPSSAGVNVYGQHGATPSISSNGNSNGIIWDIDNSAYNQDTPSSSGLSVLHAYDASNVGVELYNSAQAGSRDTAGLALKFTVPTIAGGKVFVPSGDQITVYGLLP
jgi:hypothetical protein